MAISNIPSNILAGRAVLRTDIAPNPDAEAVKADLMRVLPQHASNRQQIRSLQEYLRGWHPAIQARIKTTRTDVDNKITVNYPWSFTREITGYFLGKPIEYNHRKGKFASEMDALKGALDSENKGLVDYQIAEDCSTCGVGYRGVFNDATPLNGTHLALLRLDPKDNFVVYPADPTKAPVYAVSTYESASDNAAVTFYNVYTPSKQFVFKDMTLNGTDPVTGANLQLVETKDISFGGALPIVEYQNNQWRMGDWEAAISLIDALDAVASDGVNDIQQAVNSVLVAMGMELTLDDFKKLSANGFLNVKDIPQGTKPIVEFITQAMSADVGVSMRDYLESTLRLVVGVPDRKSRGGGGGDTGDAVFMRDGWHDIDLVAAAKEPYFIRSERQALATMLYILDTHNEMTGKVAPTDIEIHFNRNKTANLQSKAQVYQSLTSGPAALAPIDALDIAGLTNNTTDVIMRSESYRAKMQEQRINAQPGLTDKSNPNGGGTSGAGDAGGTAVPQDQPTATQKG